MKIFSKIMKGVCIIGTTTFELNGENFELFLAMVVAKIHTTNKLVARWFCQAPKDLLPKIIN